MSIALLETETTVAPEDSHVQITRSVPPDGLVGENIKPISSVMMVTEAGLIPSNAMKKPTPKKLGKPAVKPATSSLSTAKVEAKRTAKAKKDVAKVGRVAEQLAEKKSATAAPTKSELSKCRRAHLKANIVPTDEIVLALANSLIGAGVNILSKSSNRISRVLKGEVQIEKLK
jgi:hypothetical protein